MMCVWCARCACCAWEYLMDKITVKITGTKSGMERSKTGLNGGDSWNESLVLDEEKTDKLLLVEEKDVSIELGS